MSDASMINNLASIATGMKSENVMTELSVAILKQTLDQQQMEMEALVQMMQPVPSPDLAVGQNVDFSV